MHRFQNVFAIIYLFCFVNDRLAFHSSEYESKFSLLNCQWEISFVKVSLNKIDSFWFRCSFILFKCRGLIFFGLYIKNLFFSFYNSNRAAFTLHHFLLKFSLTFRTMILNTLMSCNSFFSVNGRSMIDFAINSGDLSEPRSLIPTSKIKWSR